MVRLFCAAAVLAALVASTGCRMSAAPYDCCGPVWSKGASENCNVDYRAGSLAYNGPRGVPPTPPKPASNGNENEEPRAKAPEPAPRQAADGLNERY